MWVATAVNRVSSFAFEIGSRREATVLRVGARRLASVTGSTLQTRDLRATTPESLLV